MNRVRRAHLAGDGVPLDGPDAIADLVTAGQVQGAGMALWAHVVNEAVLPLGGDLLAQDANAGACARCARLLFVDGGHC